MLDTTQRASVAVPVTGHAFVARQPIFDSQKRVYGYELLFRNSEQSVICDAADGSAATSAVIAGTLFELGHADVLGGNRGFYNFTRDHLLRDNSRILDPRRTVIEVLESVAPDDEVVAACIRLKAHGFSLALDDFDPNGPSSPLVRFADIIKVDFRETDPAVQRQLAGRFGPRGVTMLAARSSSKAAKSRDRRHATTSYSAP
jgi:c-di-GMP-related signal transduction protein